MVLEGGLDFDELNVEPPQLGGIAAGQIGAQQIAAFAPAHLAQLLAVERVSEGGFVRVDLDIEETPCRPRLGAAAPSFISRLSRVRSICMSFARRAHMCFGVQN